jgi:hypothetical protein
MGCVTTGVSVAMGCVTTGVSVWAHAMPAIPAIRIRERRLIENLMRKNLQMP